MQKVIEIKRITDKTPYFLLDSTNSEVGDKVVVNFDEYFPDYNERIQKRREVKIRLLFLYKK